MKEPLYKKYADTKAVGYYGMSNYGGLEILDIEYGIDDYVVACFNWGTGRQKIARYKIQYSTSGRTFIRKQGYRFYMDQIMRTEV